jgi:hypothetical protein
MSQSETMELNQEAFVNGDSLNADILIQTEYQELGVSVTLERGEFLVLGDSTIQTEDGSAGFGTLR